MSGWGLRPARPGEEDALSDLAMRSKASWGYDAAFMAACREALRVRPEEIAAGLILVAERQAGPVGMAGLSLEGDAAHLEYLFVEPALLGAGLGRLLLCGVLDLAARRGAGRVWIESDPGAESFYLRMGAVRAGDVASEVMAGRRLPRLVLSLEDIRPR